MGRIDRITAVDPTWRHDPHRWGVGLEVADLHRRGVGAQESAILQIEGVLHIPRRVVRRNVEGGEVVVVGFDFRALRNPIAQAGKNIDDFFGCADQWMAVSGRHEAGWSGHIDRFAGDLGRHRRRFKRAKSPGQQGLHLLLEHVGPLTHQGALVAGQLAHGSQYSRKPPFLAEKAHAQVFEGSGAGGCFDRRSRFGFERLKLLGELVQGDGGAHRSQRWCLRRL